MPKLDTIKSVTKFVVGFSVGGITSQIIHNNVSHDTPLRKTEALVAGVVVGSMAGDASEAYIDRKFDDVANWWRENVTQRP